MSTFLHIQHFVSPDMTTDLTQTAALRKADLSNPDIRPPLNPELYAPAENEKAFFKELTKIQDDEELRKHILDVQAKAYAVGSSYLNFCAH